jgi:amino acid adenylation domain-containing protein
VTVETRSYEFATSVAQRRLWFLEQLEPGTSTFNVPYRLRLAGDLDVQALRRALQAVVDRHEALRTTFAVRDGGPVQVVAEALRLDVPLVDVSDGQRVEEEAERLAGEEARRPFDLAAGPLVRAVLLRLAPDRHDLVLVVHHLVFDGWSLDVLLDELGRQYAAWLEGAPAALPELSVQYADFAAWQLDRLRGGELDGPLRHWRARLRGAPASIDLPADRPRPAVQSPAGGRRRLDLPPELPRRLEALGREAGCTPFMAVLAAFAALLHRWTGRDDVVIGTPVANRELPETLPLIGLFVNVLALRIDLSGRPTFGELLRRVRDVALDAYANQDLPFEQLVADVQPERSASHTPLFQVHCSVEAPGGRRVTMPGLDVEVSELFNGASKWDLGLHVEAGSTAAVTYAAALFDAATADRLLGHLRTLLEGAVADPGRRLADLPLLGPEEHRLVTAGWNATAADYSREACAHDLLAAAARRDPAALALSGSGVELTYGALEERANRLAHRLREHGVGPDVRVAVCAERSPDAIVGQVAVLRAGGAFVPMDPATPRRRLATMLEAAGVRVALTRRELLATLPPVETAICLDDPEAAAGRPAVPPVTSVRPDNLAYVIFTSGSTGQPKGVQVPHRGVVNLLTWASRACGLTSRDRAAQVVTLTFDVSVLEIWATLAAGASLHVAGEETRLHPAQLVRWLSAERITAGWLPTVLGERVLAEPEAAGLPLRVLSVAGDRLHRVPRGDLPFEVHNLYGPTESSVISTGAVVRCGAPADPPIGRPVANTTAYVVDGDRRPVPVGVPGELLIGGAGLARGYLGAPALTAERFVPDPIGAAPGARLYRTGDLVRWSAAGELEFLGRMDHQVKIRGFRVEAGEVESALRAHPSVREAVVVARASARGDQRLVGYVVPAGDAPPDPRTLRAFLGETLPDYMVPAAVVVLAELPLNSSRKVDRAALPEPVETDGAAPGRTPPRTDVERMVAEAWREVLGVPEVGLYDNFFDLGGHSMLLAEVLERLQRALGREVPIMTVFRHPTVSALSDHLARTGLAEPAAAPPGHDRSRAREASLRQERQRRQERRRGRPDQEPRP